MTNDQLGFEKGGKVSQSLVKKVIGCLCTIHRRVGLHRPNLDYADALAGRLSVLGLSVERKGESRLIVSDGQEAIAVMIEPASGGEQRLRDYLRSVDLEVGLLVNFGGLAVEHTLVVRPKNSLGLLRIICPEGEGEKFQVGEMVQVKFLGRERVRIHRLEAKK